MRLKRQIKKDRSNDPQQKTRNEAFDYDENLKNDNEIADNNIGSNYEDKLRFFTASPGHHRKEGELAKAIKKDNLQAIRRICHQQQPKRVPYYDKPSKSSQIAHPLYIAVAYQKEKALGQLLQSGITPDQANQIEIRNALHMAIDKQLHHILALLLSYNAIVHKSTHEKLLQYIQNLDTDGQKERELFESLLNSWSLMGQPANDLAPLQQAIEAYDSDLKEEFGLDYKEENDLTIQQQSATSNHGYYANYGSLIQTGDCLVPSINAEHVEEPEHSNTSKALENESKLDKLGPQEGQLIKQHKELADTHPEKKRLSKSYLHVSTDRNNHILSNQSSINGQYPEPNNSNQTSDKKRASRSSPDMSRQFSHASRQVREYSIRFCQERYIENLIEKMKQKNPDLMLPDNHSSKRCQIQ